MHATPVIPGITYRVTGVGLDITVLAGHGCDAICIALNLIFPNKE